MVIVTVTVRYISGVTGHQVIRDPNGIVIYKGRCLLPLMVPVKKLLRSRLTFIINCNMWATFSFNVDFDSGIIIINVNIHGHRQLNTSNGHSFVVKPKGAIARPNQVS